MRDEYVTPEVEFVELEEEDVIVTSNCTGVYSCAGGYSPV